MDCNVDITERQLWAIGGVIMVGLCVVSKEHRTEVHFETNENV